MFKTFPEFSTLLLEDKKEYQALIKDFPPISDISFANLLTWHSTFEPIKVALLNGNLILPYWYPGMEKHAGLSVIGTNNIDETLCAIFDHLISKDEKPRVVSVPELVINHVKYPDMFTFKPARVFDEYILAVSKHYPLENTIGPRRWKIQRMLQKIGEERIEVRKLHLNSPEDKEFLLKETLSWQPKNINNFGKLEIEMIKACLLHGKDLGLENACIFVNGRLHGFCIYELSVDKKYALVIAMKATHKHSLGFELIGYELAKWFAAQGIEFVNMNSDMGLLRLRVLMLTLGPVNFFRKYIIEPSK